MQLDAICVYHRNCLTAQNGCSGAVDEMFAILREVAMIDVFRNRSRLVLTGARPIECFLSIAISRSTLDQGLEL